MNSPEEKINVMVADDHQLIHLGMKMVFEKIPEIGKIYDAYNGNEVLNIMETEKIDLIFMDITMRPMDGLTATKKLREQKNTVKIIALSLFDQTAVMRNMFLAGCDGYIVKGAISDTEVKNSIHKILAGGKYFNDEVVEKFIYDSEEDVLKKMREKFQLTESETDVMKMMCKGLTSNEIAKEVHRSKDSVDVYRKTIHQKTQTKNIAELISFAVRYHIITLDRL